MSDTKKYNSIVFLTTLSVYLGLVLVGATPSVLAQQATLAQRFEIQNEIEIEDDLDKKPDDEKIDFSKTLGDYFSEVGSFVRDLQKLYQLNKFDLDNDKFEIREHADDPCSISGHRGKGWESFQILPPYNLQLQSAVSNAKSGFKHWDFLSDCLKTDKLQTNISPSLNLKFSYDKAELKIEVSAFKSNQQRAEWLAEKFNQVSKNFQADEENKIVTQLHKFTTIKSENNQFFIITNLPRASIDSLLAETHAN